MLSLTELPVLCEIGKNEISPTLTGRQYMETFHRDLLRAIIASFSSVLVYIIDDSYRGGTEMKYPALSAQTRLLLREMALCQ